MRPAGAKRPIEGSRVRASCLALLMYAGLAGQALAQQDPAARVPGSA
ncbi:MAG: hypothetical protein IH926_12985, partial [Proteobacteria bacterium]|nr:hypothetical protein [Pseudomonadota bacterium]